MNKSDEKRREKYYSDDSIMPPECDVLCRFRPCYGKYEDKGSYSAGRGYTSYHDGFYPACSTRLSHGCGYGRGALDVVSVLAYFSMAIEEISPCVRTAKARAKLRNMAEIVSAMTHMVTKEPEYLVARVDLSNDH